MRLADTNGNVVAGARAEKTFAARPLTRERLELMMTSKPVCFELHATNMDECSAEFDDVLDQTAWFRLGDEFEWCRTDRKAIAAYKTVMRLNLTMTEC